MHAELRFRGVRVGRKRVERLMRAVGVSGLVKRKRGRTTISVPGVRVADDLVERDLNPPAPDLLWVADITYARTWEGWLYVAVCLDCFSRPVVASRSPTTCGPSSSSTHSSRPSLGGVRERA